MTEGFRVIMPTPAPAFKKRDGSSVVIVWIWGNLGEPASLEIPFQMVWADPKKRQRPS